MAQVSIQNALPKGADTGIEGGITKKVAVGEDENLAPPSPVRSGATPGEFMTDFFARHFTRFASLQQEYLRGICEKFVEEDWELGRP